jgi:DNA-binding LacI/PurR family transcriptional regulator
MKPPHEDSTNLRGDPAHPESRIPRTLGELPQKTITMAQIAKAAGVSQGAISSLLNDRDYGIRVSEKTRERVFKVCREMGYVPNDLRAVVRMYPELGDVCLLVSSTITGGIADPFVSRLAQGASQGVGESSHPLTIAFYNERIDYHSVEPDDTPAPIRSGISSKFLCYGHPNNSLFQSLIRRGHAVVSLGVDVPIPGVLSIVPDYEDAARLAIERLYRLGHEHIAIVSGPFGTTDHEILDLHHGVKMAYDELNVPIETQNIVYTDLSHTGGANALDELLAHPVKPTAVFCLSDAAAAGVLSRAQQRKMQVPGELSVIGCGDGIAASLVYPSLTTIHIPAELMALTGVREAEKIVQNGFAPGPRKEVLPVQLVERSTLASPALAKA